MLAGIPTIVYGYFALTFITPLFRTFFPKIQIFNAFSASIVVGIMILPMIASLCDNTFRAVPDSLRQGAYAVGATQYEVTTGVVIPSALSGVMAAFVLALSRAIGETMAVTLAAGATTTASCDTLNKDGVVYLADMDGDNDGSNEGSTNTKFWVIDGVCWNNGAGSVGSCDGSGDAKGAIFAPQAFGLCMAQEIEADDDKDIRSRGTDIVTVGVWGETEIVDNWAVEAYSAADVIS